MKIGYARVSTEEQNLDTQLEKLRAAGCDPVFTDRMSGASEDRPGLNEALERLRPGDVLVVWRLDRLGRSVLHLVALLEQLHSRKIEFCSLTDNIDTTTPFGELHFTMVSALAQFERRMIAMRTKETMQAAKARGIKFGRKPKLTLQQARDAKMLIDAGRFRREVALTLNVSEPTLRRSLRAFGLEKGNEVDTLLARAADRPGRPREPFRLLTDPPGRSPPPPTRLAAFRAELPPAWVEPQDAQRVLDGVLRPETGTPYTRPKENPSVVVLATSERARSRAAPALFGRSRPGAARCLRGHEARLPDDAGTGGQDDSASHGGKSG